MVPDVGIVSELVCAWREVGLVSDRELEIYVSFSSYHVASTDLPNSLQTEFFPKIVPTREIDLAAGRACIEMPLKSNQGASVVDSVGRRRRLTNYLEVGSAAVNCCLHSDLQGVVTIDRPMTDRDHEVVLFRCNPCQVRK